MRKIEVFIALVVFILAGCVHFGTVATNIAPTVTAPQKYPARVALYFSPKLSGCEVVRKPDTSYGAEHEYRYLWGPALEEALTKSIKTAYTNVTRVSSTPRPGQFDRVLSFDLTKADLLVEFVPGYLEQEAKARARINLTLEVLDGKTLNPLKKFPIMAQGSSTADASGLAAYAPGKFSAAMERAIQQLSEIVSNLVITGAAEPH